jgi:hypothetical protein
MMLSVCVLPITWRATVAALATLGMVVPAGYKKYAQSSQGLLWRP